MRARKVSAFAPGKLIVTGEHSVVYGYQAIAMAVDLGVWVELEEIGGESVVENGDTLISSAIKTLLPPRGIKMSFRSNLPIGRGMGSSAALSIAFIRALARWENRESTFEEEFQKGLQLETFFHGNPSGLDHTVSSRGQTLIYTKSSQGPKTEPLPSFGLSLVIVDSGSAGNTAQMVQIVKDNYKRNQVFLKQLGAITLRIKEQLVQATLDERKLGTLFVENHQLLQKIGVSTPALNHIVAEALARGALGAKLSGSGGGGIVMILTKNPQRMLEEMNQLGYKGFIVRPYSRPH